MMGRKKHALVVIVLVLALAATNFYWVFQGYTQGIAISYCDEEVRFLSACNNQLIGILKEMAAGLERDKMISIVQKHTSAKPIVKNNNKEVCIGEICIEFDQSNKIVNIIPIWR